MTSYAAVVSLMNTMKQIQIHHRLSFAFHNKQFESLFEKLGFLLHHIKGNSHGGSKEEELEQLIARAAHAAEDIIESHIVDQIHAAGSISLLDLRSVLKTFDFPMKEVMEFEGSKNVELIGSADELIQPLERLLRKNTMMIGFEEEMNQLMEMLIGQKSSRQIIPIVGMGGIGKTTLARNAYENLTSKDHFDIRAWATISQNYNVRETLLQLLSIKGKSTVADIGTKEELGEKLHKSLCGRRYLVILDDLWSVEDWEKIMFFFPDNSNGSRVVVTTRLSNMGTYFASSCLAMSFLEDGKSWSLFQEKAFGQQGCPLELEGIGKEIAKKCKGLPLSITVIGGFLGKSPMTRKYWQNVANDIYSVSNSGEDDEQCSNILSTSYTHLPAHLKPCFLYMGVFREDEEIRVSRLIKLWVSEGFLEPNEAQTLEEIAEGYVNDLVDRNLITVSRWEVSGKIKTCNVHDVLRDLCLRTGEKEKFLRVIRPFNFLQDIALERRLVLPGAIPNPPLDVEYIPDPPHDDDEYIPDPLHDDDEYPTNPLYDEYNCPCALDDDDEYYYPDALDDDDDEYYCPDALDDDDQYYCPDAPDDDVQYYCPEDLEALRSASLARSLFSKTGKLGFKLRLLRVLENVDWPLIGQVNLRYISFDNNDDIAIDELPIWSLQTFICRIWKSGIAPLDIWKMQQLRHLEVNCLYLPEPDQQSGGFVLQNLQTLSGVVNLRLNAEVCRRIPNVRTLRIQYYNFSYDCHFLGNLHQLYKLESLHLHFSGSAEPFPHYLTRKLFFPSALRKLTLEECEIRWEDLTSIGCCPNLEVLKLLGGELIGSEWSPVEGQFICLKKLKIDSYENHLIRWNADYTHFPVLEKLVLGRFSALEEIPSGVGDISTLQHIHLFHSSDSIALSAMRILQDQIDNLGYEEFEVQVVFRDRLQRERFKKLMMETESFTCKNVQLSLHWH